MDLLRQNAKRLVGGFPLTLPGYEELGYHDAKAILDEPIKDAEGVARWTDSIFNASVPMIPASHTGVLPHGAGIHHYPKPVVDIDLFRFADFVLWVTDPRGHPMAVAPVAPRGSGDGRIEVLYSHPGSVLARQHHAAHSKGERLILPDDHPLAKQAFSRQT